MSVGSGLDVTRDAAVDVYLTVDVELWCDGWVDIDRKFPAAFRRYIYGPTPRGDYGLPYSVQLLRDHGLRGTFFVEPLFAARFGAQPLAEIVGLLNDGGQDVQLHLHTEWVDEAREPLLPNVKSKRQHLFQYSVGEQSTLLRSGRRLLESAGTLNVKAFRAGSFAFNRDTLAALPEVGIAVDASYNATMFGPQSGVRPAEVLTDSLDCDGIVEVPMTVFRDGMGRLRHVQLTACSWVEIESLLWQALRQGQRSFVILSHNFELLDPSQTRPDKVVLRRFRRLCQFLERNADAFRMRNFDTNRPRVADAQPRLLRATPWASGLRLAEQVYRRVTV